MFSETLGNKRIVSRTVGPGDMLEVSIWEAAPATLFSTVPLNGNMIATSRPTTLGQLRDIPGIGDKKLEHYGDELIALVRASPTGA